MNKLLLVLLAISAFSAYAEITADEIALDSCKCTDHPFWEKVNALIEKLELDTES